MAIYHCSIKTIGRSAGRSAVASAAYRSGVCLEDERTGEVHDYTRKSGIEHTELIIPEGVTLDREQLWNAAEASEKRKNSTVAREYEVALPEELNPEQRTELARDFARHLVDRYGVAVDVSIHAPSRGGDSRNYHAHILTTTRQVTPQGFAAKTRALDDKKTGEIEHVRATWAQLTNQALERAGHPERVSHKSLEAQGIDREPTIHLGPAATAMERRGIQTERGELNRAAQAVDAQAAAIERDLKQLDQLQAGLKLEERNEQKRQKKAENRECLVFDENSMTKLIIEMQERHSNDLKNTYSYFIDRINRVDNYWSNVDMFLIEHGFDRKNEGDVYNYPQKEEDNERKSFREVKNIEEEINDFMKKIHDAGLIYRFIHKNDIICAKLELEKQLKAAQEKHKEDSKKLSERWKCRKLVDARRELFRASPEYKLFSEREKEREAEKERRLAPYWEKRRQRQRARERDHGWSR